MDETLPILSKARPLRYLFLDLNSYFASCEQLEDPGFRRKPVAVAPLYADTTFVIAASYEAKKFGVKCGVMVRDAKRLCPNLLVVGARPTVYVGYHKKVLEVAETVLPIDKVCSIDEMRFRLLGDEMKSEVAVGIARRLKHVIRTEVGECLTSSVGIASNPFLAKVASDMEKPDGLVAIDWRELPYRLHHLKLTDYPGLNKKMEARLNGCGIFTSEELHSATRHELHMAFGSVIGERWWYLLRGFEIPAPEDKRKSLGHSHVLPPEFRTDDGCRDVLMRLLNKAAARLRSEGLHARSMSIHVGGFKRSWECRVRMSPTQDTMYLMQVLNREWEGRDFVSPRKVGVTFHELHEVTEVTPSLFDPQQDRRKLNKAVDSVNQRFGKNSIYVASLEKVKDKASEKIAFNKTWLFQEGKGDNEWTPLPESE